MDEHDQDGKPYQDWALEAMNETSAVTEFEKIPLQEIIQAELEKREIKWDKEATLEALRKAREKQKIIFTPIYPQERKTVRSEKEYISVSMENGQLSQLGEIDTYTNPKERIIAICGPSPEAIQFKQRGEDAVSIAEVEKEGETLILVSEADGVGESYFAEIAARELTNFITERGSVDLKDNFRKLKDEVKNIQIDKPDTGFIYLDEALNNIRVRYGSVTTLNQLLISPDSGEVKGYFHGDGEIAIIRSDGDIERHSCGSDASIVSTKHGVQGESKELNDKLNSGDIIMLFSDGLDKLGASALKNIASQIQEGKENEDTAKNIWEHISSQELRDDDRSLIIYRHE